MTRLPTLSPMSREAFTQFATDASEAHAHDPADVTVGQVWFAVVGAGEARAGHVHSIRILPERQRKGHGKRTLLGLESVAAGMELPAIRLNVSGHHPGAQELYSSLGHQVTSSSMRESLRK